jgi:hypothetical protein
MKTVVVCSSEKSVNFYQTKGVTSKKKILFIRINSEGKNRVLYVLHCQSPKLRMTMKNLGQDKEHSLKTDFPVYANS